MSKYRPIHVKRRSREGAWIEILVKYYRRANPLVAPARERGLKFLTWVRQLQQHQVAPARERGLKSISLTRYGAMVIGRSREGAWIEISWLIASYNLS